MKKITCILLTIVILISSISTCNAASPIAAESGVPKFRYQNVNNFDYRVYTLRKFLSKNGSPLTPYSQEFVAQADFYGIDYRFVPAITGVESTFGKRIPVNSYNAYGWANGKYTFDSWPDSIEIVSKTLRNNYVNRGAASIGKIAKIYAPPSATWGNKVKFFISKINTLPLSFDI